VVETNGQALVEQLKMIPGSKHVCLEEGTQSAWLYEILSPHATEVVVTMVPESRGQKDDQRDAFALAERLRTGAIERKVFKEAGEYKTLRELGRTHAMVVQDVVRVQNRLKALFRSRGVAVSGKSIYSEKGRGEPLEKLPDASRGAAKTLYAQYDAVEAIRRQAEKDLVAGAHRHPISRVLETCPGLGPIRVAQLIPIVVSPGRFRTKRQFWSYCGLGIVMRSSSDWVRKPGDDRDLAARSRSLVPGLPAAHQRGHETEPREGDGRSQARCNRSFDVEELGEVRPDEASQARFIARLTCGNVDPQGKWNRWRSTSGRARFEGEHPLRVWPGAVAPRSHG
jgi:transposase